MGLMSFVFALFTIGYILGVWTACLVFRQPQREYEDGRHASAMVLARVPSVELIRQ
jgi:hypothetical protein